MSSTEAEATEPEFGATSTSVATGSALLDAPLAWVEVGDLRIAYRQWGFVPAVNETTVVMLHEGLGSTTQWRDLPARLAATTGLTVVAYDRSGYGRSSAEPATYGRHFMEHEAIVVLPELLAALGIERPALVGHSDGATIALIAADADVGVDPCAVAVIAPHTFLEQECLDGIDNISAQREAVLAGLAKHHDNPALAFDRWRTVWLSEEFRGWDVREMLPNIGAPVLALQGTDDGYATDAQIHEITDAVPDAQGFLVDNCGHVAHRDQPEEVCRLIGDFLKKTVLGSPAPA